MVLDKRISQSVNNDGDARIESIRAKHAQLRDRFLNPRIRMVGRDENALLMQIAEKEERKRREREEDQMYSQHVADMTMELSRMDLQQREANKRKQQDLLNTWKQQSDEEARKRAEEKHEYAQYYDRNARATGTAGVSSAQQLDGEDTYAEQRKRLQALQLKKWCEQQQQEKLDRQQREQEDEARYAEHVKNFTQYTDDLFMEQQRARRAAEDEVKRYNLQQTRDAELKRQRDKQQELDDWNRSLSEQQNAVVPIVENGGVKRADNPFRFCKDRFKGFGEEEKKRYYRDQLAQVAEKQERKRIEREEEREWATHQEMILQVASDAVSQHLDDRDRQNKDTLATIQQQIADKQARDRAYREYERQPAVTDDFFGRFGQSHR